MAVFFSAERNFGYGEDTVYKMSIRANPSVHSMLSRSATGHKLFNCHNVMFPLKHIGQQRPGRNR